MQNELKELTGGAMCQHVHNPLQPQKQPEDEPEKGSDVQNITPYTDCPNCHKPWCMEEIEYQACDNCGYPLHKIQNRLNYEVYDFSRGYFLH